MAISSNTIAPNTMAPNTMALRGGVAIFVGASVWGVFWLPLDYFDANGVRLLWAIAAVNLLGFFPAIGMAIAGEQLKFENPGWLILIGACMGFAIVFYLSGLMLTDVVRAVFLFYLLPIWATLFSWAIFGAAIGRVRLLALLLALVGIWLLLGAGGWPVPQNIGDVFALFSGIVWGFGLTMVSGKLNAGSTLTVAAAMFCGFFSAVIMALLLSALRPDIQPPMPEASQFANMALPLAAFGMLVLFPSMLAMIWGTQQVSATTSALLTMSEILVATLSTYLLASSDMELVSWIGAALIVSAIFVDIAGAKHG